MKEARMRALKPRFRRNVLDTKPSRNEGSPYEGIETLEVFFNPFRDHSRNEGSPYEGIETLH